jgi:hypothetical protein
MIPQKIINWLKIPDYPSIKYRTMIEILEKNENEAEVIGTKDQIVKSIPVQTILNKKHPNGYWIQKNPRTGEILGKDLKYGAFGTTHYCFIILS